MSYINSKKYKSAVQLYHKANGDIAYYITFKDASNRLRRKKIGNKSAGITESICNQRRISIINKINQGEEFEQQPNREIITLDHVAHLYFDYLQLHSSQGSIREIKSKYTNHLQPTLGSRNIEKITSDDLEKIQRDKLASLSHMSINQVIQLFGTIFYFGKKKELYHTNNPVSKITKLKINNTRERFLAKEEISSLHREIGKDALLSLFCKLSLETGGRLETVLHIQKKHIDLDNRIIILQDIKSGSTYNGFISINLEQELRPIMARLTSNDFIIGGNRIKFTSRQIQSRLKPILDKLFNKGLELDDRKNRVVIHTLRHTFASHLAIMGTPIFTIQKLMNHKDIKHTIRYAKLSPEAGRDFVEQLYV